MIFCVLKSELDDDERCFVDNLYTRYEKQIYGIAFGIVRKNYDAEDVVSTVMINDIKNLTKFIGKSAHEIKRQPIMTAISRYVYHNSRKRTIV